MSEHAHVWINSEPKDAGYEVRRTRNGHTFGFVRRGVLFRTWIAYCWSEECGEVGTGYRTRPAAAARLAEHFGIAHR